MNPGASRRRSTLLALVGALAFVPATAEAQTAPPAGAVATVGDAVIAETTFRQWLRVRGSTRVSVMSFLIHAQWIRQESRAKGIDVAPEQVRRVTRRLKRARFKSEREHERFLRRSRLTRTQVLYRVRTDVLAERLRRAVAATAAPVTSGDVTRYIRANRRELRGLSRAERRRRARRILVDGSRRVAVELWFWEFRQRWRSATACAEGYFVSECGNEPEPAAPTRSSASGLRA